WVVVMAVSIWFFGREDKGFAWGKQWQKGNLWITRRKTGGNGGFFGVGFFGGGRGWDVSFFY
ncbi:MAG: hypothetical protein MJZ63_06240, partial [Muribaculaceae bacterium]|nr:hypothetical protein [Muribaculaceae bacterium]